VRGARERERFEFLATVGHELRTPLTSIRGYIETVLDDEIDRRTSRRFLETARREALRLARLVEGMLEFSLLDSSSMYAGAADVVALVHGAVEALHPIAAESGVTLTVQADGTALGRIGADACMHALLNLIENGIKYARAGGRVGVTVERQDPFVCVLVDDDGPGVAYADRERIFAYRERGNAPEGVRGAGVGLTIVRTVVERVGGRVHVEVSPAGGARFVVALPLFKAEPEGNAS
ncbi:MAG TPA: HAMP domain-containing sensor histidine kinase, partial [Candidatus Aquilonibacter sp.]|nr:HAMP domain-containing sensor histidine kinase [Candidatus Aquilonibacter sp.]